MLETDVGVNAWGQEVVGSAPTAASTQVSGPARVGHVADCYHRYPGEMVTLFTQVEILETQSDLTLRISIPEDLAIGDYRPPVENPGAVPFVEEDEGMHYMVWLLKGEVPEGSKYLYQVQAVVNPIRWNKTLKSMATLTTADHQILAEEELGLQVWSKGRYLRYLPELYEQDELMGRFLMLFESFWAPIENQINNVQYYLDPRTTPPKFLPWLASWLDLQLDESWPEDRLRQLIRWAIALHRSRGTKWGLLKYLELYTGQKAVISERRAKNFIIGSEAKLGPGIALGQGNIPHTFSVQLRLSPIEAESEVESVRLEALRRRNIEKIIDMQKPAHTVYTLDLQIAASDEWLAVLGEEPESPAETTEEGDEISAQAAVWFKLDDEG